MSINIGDRFFDKWEVVNILGKGNFGAVYDVVRKEYDREYHSAMKVVSVPQNQEDYEALKAELNDEEKIRAYYSNKLHELSSELDLMSKLKGNSNIVSYEDHEIIPHNEDIGFDLFIRMELLEPLTDYIKKNGSISVEEVIKLGIDICNALEICEKNSIIHRDIKPQNIFISKSGNYKLGDFGVAKQLENDMFTLTRVGTSQFIAPEVFHGYQYDTSADIYSLGLVLYYYLNDKMSPFVDESTLTFEKREKANMLRLNGETFPDPINGFPELNRVILKACSFLPKDRFASASAFRKALQYALKCADEVGKEETEFFPTRTVVLPSNQNKAKMSIPVTSFSDESKKNEDEFEVSKEVETKKEKKKEDAKVIAITASVVVVVLAILAVVLAPKIIGKQKQKDGDPTARIEKEYSFTDRFKYEEDGKTIILGEIGTDGTILSASDSNGSPSELINELQLSKFFIINGEQKLIINADMYIGRDFPVTFATGDYNGDNQKEYSISYYSNAGEAEQQSLIIASLAENDFWICSYDDEVSKQISDCFVASKDGEKLVISYNGVVTDYSTAAKNLTPEFESAVFDIVSYKGEIKHVSIFKNQEDGAKIILTQNVVFDGNSISFCDPMIEIDDKNVEKINEQSEMIETTTTTTTTTTTATTTSAKSKVKPNKDKSYFDLVYSDDALKAIKIVLWGSFKKCVDDSCVYATFSTDSRPLFNEKGEEVSSDYNIFYNCEVSMKDNTMSITKYGTDIDESSWTQSVDTSCKYYDDHVDIIIELTKPLSFDDECFMEFYVSEGAFVTENGESNDELSDYFYF